MSKLARFSEKAQLFYKETIDWDKSDRESLKNRAEGWKYLGIAGWVMFIIVAVSIIPLLTLHQFVPINVTVDRFSGDYSIRIGKERVDINDKKNEQRMVSDIGRFVKARESFTRGEAENNFKIVYYSLPEENRGAWEHLYNGDKNPRALMNIMSPKDQIRVDHPSITWLPSDNDKFKVAQYRFEKIRKIGGRKATRQPYIATLTYYYDVDNVPTEIDGLIANAFGFTVTNYRADFTGPEREIRDDEQEGQP